MVRYYSAVCRALAQMGCRIELPLLVSGSDFIDGRMQALNIILSFIPGRTAFWIFSRISKRWYYHKLRKGGYDAILVTSPVFEDAFLNYAGQMPFIMVVHDTMRCIPGPDGFFDSAGSNADRLAYLARRAARIVCVSKATQKDLMAFCPAAREKTEVIYIGHLLEGNPVIPARQLPGKYLLFVGERTGRKNFRFLVQAIGALMKQHKEVKLICTGKFSRWERDLIEGLGIEGQCIDMDVTDGELLYLYQHALCLVYPSLFEGFGLPVLEAMANSCPVVTADSGSIREVGGEAVEYVDPFDAASIAAGVAKIILEESYRTGLAERGRRQAGLFSKERMMQSLLAELSRLSKTSVTL
jgi:glycosyltransferase involved in cell wall biosynthesis